MAKPVDDLILLLSKLLLKSTPQIFAESTKIVKSKFCTSVKSFGRFVDKFITEI